jgi:glycosyltransferase involved in cell wall biosynthesis
MMNIVHISTATTWRGGEQQIANLYEALRQHGLSQFIVCASGSELEKYALKQGWSVLAVPKLGSIGFGFARAIADTCQRFQADLVHIHDSHAHNNAVLAAVWYGMKTPMVLSRRVHFPVSGNVFSKWKYNYKGIKAIICVSAAVREVLFPSIKDTAKLLVVHDGIDTEHIPQADGRLRGEYQIPPDTLMIGNVAALTPEKDHITFLKTVARLKNHIQARYFIIGEGAERKRIEQTIEELGLQGDVVLTGFRADAKQLLAELDVLLVTSVKEGLGSTVLDAFICQVPVVATAAGGIPEMVHDEETGLLGAIQSPTVLAEQVLKVVNQPAYRQTLTNNAYRLAIKHSATNMAEQTLGIYKTVMAK